MRKCSVVACTVGLLWGTTGVWARSTDVAKLAAEAVKKNSSLKALGTRTKALEALVDSADAYPDPTLALDYSNMPIDRWAPSFHPMSGVQLMLKQRFLWPGKQRLRRRVAQERVQLVKARRRSKALKLSVAVHRAYHRLALVRQERTLIKQHVALLARLVAALRARYEVGLAQQHQLMSIQLAKQRLAERIADLIRDERELLIAINATLERPLATAVHTPPRTHTPPAPSLGALKRQHPELLRLAAHKRFELARAARVGREGMPDITGWVGYRLRLAAGADPGTDFVSFGISLPLPLSARHTASSRKKAALRAAAVSDDEQRALRRRLQGQVRAALVRWQRARKRAGAYRSKHLPLLRRALQSAINAFSVGKASFSELVQLERQLLSFQQIVLGAEAQAALARVTIFAATGVLPADKGGTQ